MEWHVLESGKLDGMLPIVLDQWAKCRRSADDVQSVQCGCVALQKAFKDKWVPDIYK